MNQHVPQQPIPPMPPTPPTEPTKPVAYDQYGRPLYAHPPAQPAAPTQAAVPTPAEQPTPPVATQDSQGPTDANQPPQVVYMSRAVDPHEQEPSPEVKAKHDESVRRFPHLNLSSHEYVISAVKRHPIGLVSIWAVVALGVLIIFIGFPLLITASSSLGGNGLSPSAVVYGGLTLLMVAVLFVLGGIIATVIYNANRFYLTNESVIQHIQTSLFSKKDQTISLQNIEDASYRQKGMLQTILNYGSIRLSTEGEETTYRFNFVAHPKRQIDLLNNAVEAFKNFRPVDPSDS